MTLWQRIIKILNGYTAEERVAIQERWIAMKVDAAMERHTNDRLNQLADYLNAHLEEDEAAERAESDAWIAKMREHGWTDAQDRPIADKDLPPALRDLSRRLDILDAIAEDSGSIPDEEITQ
jgi:hypothetical protein